MASLYLLPYNKTLLPDHYPCLMHIYHAEGCCLVRLNQTVKFIIPTLTWPCLSLGNLRNLPQKNRDVAENDNPYESEIYTS